MVRDGRRPERTVYRITDDGRAEFDDWMAELLGRAAKEFPQFEAGLSLMGVLPPDRVVELLHERVARSCRHGCSELDADRRGGHPQRRAADLPRRDGLRARARRRRLRVHRTARRRHRVGPLDGSFWKVHADRGTVARDGRSRRAMNAIVEVEGIARSFGDTQALCGVDLSVPEGGVVALLGPNGAGKTTLVRILSTLLAPDAGTARVAGFDVVEQPMAVRRVHRPRRAVRRRRRDAHRPREPRDDRPAVAPRRSRSRPSAPPRCSTGCRSPTPPTVRSRRIRAACAGASTSAPASSPSPRAPARRADHRPRPREPARAVGLPARARERRRHHPAHDAVPRGGRPTRVRRSSSSTTARSSRPGTPLELKQRLAGDVLDVTVADDELDRVGRAAARRRLGATDRRPRHQPGHGAGRRWRRQPGRGGAPPRRSRASRSSTSRCAARRSTTCSCRSPATPPTDGTDAPEEAE